MDDIDTSYDERKIYLSYFEDDWPEVEAFMERFNEQPYPLITRAPFEMAEDIVKSGDSDYVKRRIREAYLKDSVVTVVLLGRCTWTRRIVDWELLASLENRGGTLPNGLLGVMLPSYEAGDFPDRLNLNLRVDEETRDCYARVIPYPKSQEALTYELDDAFGARTARTHLVVNPAHMFNKDRACL
jgi:hypothetical protein